MLVSEKYFCLLKVSVQSVSVAKLFASRDEICKCVLTFVSQQICVCNKDLCAPIRICKGKTERQMPFTPQNTDQNPQLAVFNFFYSSAVADPQD